MVTKLRIRAYNSQVPLVLVNYLLQDDLYEKHGNMTKNTNHAKHISILHIAKEKRGPQPSKLGPRISGEQAQNLSKPTQLCATPPWAKSRRSQEAAQQNWTQGGPPRVWPHP